MTKLQIALDDTTMEKAVSLLDIVHADIDIIEIGTPFMMAYGMEAVRTMKQRYPDCEVLCDAKIMDAGSYEADLTFQAGADYVTVLGVTDDRTIQDIVTLAHTAYGDRKVMVDMICVQDPAKRVAQLETMQVDVIAVHTGVDQQAMGRTPLEDLRDLHALVQHTPLAVAGGIKAETIDAYLAYDPEIVIVGGGIAHAADPVKAVAELRAHLS